MNKALLLAAMLFYWMGVGSLAYAETFDDALVAFNEANASKDPNNPGYAKAFEIWAKLAATEDLPSTYHLGIMYLYGIGGAEWDQIRAFALIRTAAEGGYPKAQALMGLTLERGDGLYTRTNPDEARQWYEKAANSGHCYSVRRLAHAHEKGELGMAVSAQSGQTLRSSRPECFEAKS